VNHASLPHGANASDPEGKWHFPERSCQWNALDLLIQNYCHLSTVSPQNRQSNLSVQTMSS